MSTSASHDVERRCVPHLLDEVDIKITVHHSLELLVVAMAARHAVAACRIDLKLHAPRRFPQLRVLCADLFPDDAKFLFKVLGIHRCRHAVLRAALVVLGLLCSSLNLAYPAPMYLHRHAARTYSRGPGDHHFGCVAPAGHLSLPLRPCFAIRRIRLAPPSPKIPNFRAVWAAAPRNFCPPSEAKC